MSDDMIIGLIVFLLSQLMLNIYALSNIKNRLTKVETHLLHVMGKLNIHERNNTLDELI